MQKYNFIRISAVILLFVSLIMISCGDDSTPVDSNDNDNGDSSQPVEDVSYSDDIQPIFNDSCGGSGCHIESPQSGVQLNSYDNVMNSTGLQYERDIVQPEDPNDSPIVDKIEPNPSRGARMPLNGTPLTDRQIEEIRVWIEEGALDN